MSYWVNTTGNSVIGIGVCDRCHQKFPLTELFPDANSPGLKVCMPDRDGLDPYRLPARQTERINLPFVRPDVEFTIPAEAAEPEDTFDVLATEIEEPLLTEDGDYLIPEEALPEVGPVITAEEGDGGYSIGYFQAGQGSITNEDYYPGLTIRAVQDIFVGAFAYDAFRIYLSADPPGAPPAADVISTVRINGLWFHVANADVNEASGSDRIIAWFGSAGLVAGEQYTVELI